MQTSLRPLVFWPTFLVLLAAVIASYVDLDAFLAGLDERRRDESDVHSADSVLATLATDTRRSTAEIRRDLATVIRQLGSRHTRDLLIPLLHDTGGTVADEAMR